MKKILRKVSYVAVGILLVWTILTVWAQYTGAAKTLSFGDASSSKKALIVYNPDPIYNLDEQVCIAFAQGLVTQDFHATVATVQSQKAAQGYDLYVFCGNTYNWAPDWLITNYINNHQEAFVNKKAIAIMVGAGSTKRAKRLLQQSIKKTNAHLVDARTYWLMRPNDETRMEENNNKVAQAMANAFGVQIGQDW